MRAPHRCRITPMAKCYHGQWQYGPALREPRRRFSHSGMRASADRWAAYGIKVREDGQHASGHRFSELLAHVECGEEVLIPKEERATPARHVLGGAAALMRFGLSPSI